MGNRSKEKASAVGKQIRLLRESRNMTQNELAQKLYKSESAVRMWELEKSEPDIQTLEILASIFDVSIDFLLGKIKNSSTAIKGIQIPVYGEIAAGIPIDAIENIIDFEEITPEMASLGEYLALKIKGDSMSPRICNGDVVIIRKQESVESGDIAAVLVNGDSATLKRVKKLQSGISLLSINPAFEPLFYTNEEIEKLPITIIGKMVELRGKF